MAVLEACEQALAALSARLAGVDGELRRRHAPDRTLGLTVPDLSVTWTAVLRDGLLVDLARAPAGGGEARPQIRLATSSDDLLALVDGELGVAMAWATGRLKVEASPMDLLRLRSLL